MIKDILKRKELEKAIVLSKEGKKSWVVTDEKEILNNRNNIKKIHPLINIMTRTEWLDFCLEKARKDPSILKAVRKKTKARGIR